MRFSCGSGALGSNMGSRMVEPGIAVFGTCTTVLGSGMAASRLFSGRSESSTEEIERVSW